ncbi:MULTISPECIES: NUDIX hydrolase [Planococcus]|uniref:NUDIX domain-containing protein n=1 Tax=Planococcus wigleyi TaxID=2762216 RepID=A0ABR8WD36_9BACL|nr:MULTISPECIES: NUDIX domain-containing protein [Planococcus]MBD8014932.1 NUDIX domain-containing protein [Planococcus wigleyi]MDN3439128.1 NUDIX domain-containing protein [Planococcus sp. APC 3900]
METEKLRVYDEHGNPQGIETRQAVHEQGLWHETFHCWMVGRRNNRDTVYLQLRSEAKKDFPGLFDITAAGHLLADETVEDGVREVKEELGLEVDFDKLILLGMVKDQMEIPGFIDNERCHCFLYPMPNNNDLRFELQLEEVSGMGEVDFEALADLFAGKEEEVEIDGFIATLDGHSPFKKRIGLKEIVPHSSSYLEKIIYLIRQELNK